jgi:hypothetical protein
VTKKNWCSCGKFINRRSAILGIFHTVSKIRKEDYNFLLHYLSGGSDVRLTSSITLSKAKTSFVRNPDVFLPVVTVQELRL